MCRVVCMCVCVCWGGVGFFCVLAGVGETILCHIVLLSAELLHSVLEDLKSIIYTLTLLYLVITEKVF